MLLHVSAPFTLKKHKERMSDHKSVADAPDAPDAGVPTDWDGKGAEDGKGTENSEKAEAVLCPFTGTKLFDTDGLQCAPCVAILQDLGHGKQSICRIVSPLALKEPLPDDPIKLYILTADKYSVETVLENSSRGMSEHFADDVNQLVKMYIYFLGKLRDSFLKKPTTETAFQIEVIYSQLICAFHKSPKVAKYLFEYTSCIRYKLFNMNGAVNDTQKYHPETLLLMLPVFCQLDNRVDFKTALYELFVLACAQDSKRQTSKQYMKNFRCILQNQKHCILPVVFCTLVGKPYAEQVKIAEDIKSLCEDASKSVCKSLTLSDEMVVFIRTFLLHTGFTAMFCPSYSDTTVDEYDKTRVIDIGNVMEGIRKKARPYHNRTSIHSVHQRHWDIACIFLNGRKMPVVRCRCGNYGANVKGLYEQNPKIYKKMIGVVYVYKNILYKIVDFVTHGTEYLFSDMRPDVELNTLRKRLRKIIDSIEYFEWKIRPDLGTGKNSKRVKDMKAKIKKLIETRGEIQNILRNSQCFENNRSDLVHVKLANLSNGDTVTVHYTELMCPCFVKASRGKHCRMHRFHFFSRKDGELNCKVLCSYSKLEQIITIQAWYRAQKARKHYKVLPTLCLTRFFLKLVQHRREQKHTQCNIVATKLVAGYIAQALQ